MIIYGWSVGLGLVPAGRGPGVTMPACGSLDADKVSQRPSAGWS